MAPSTMKIAVCIKQVPTREWQPRLNDDKTWVRDQDVSYEMNEPDAYALEEGLRLREKHGGEVVVCSAGPSRVQQVIREALARGADRALHVEDDALGAADAFTAAAALAPSMGEQKFDLILTGLQSDDQGHAQFGPVLAEKLGIPHSTIIMEVNVDGSSLRVKREHARDGRGRCCERAHDAVFAIDGVRGGQDIARRLLAQHHAQRALVDEIGRIGLPAGNARELQLAARAFDSSAEKSSWSGQRVISRPATVPL